MRRHLEIFYSILPVIARQCVAQSVVKFKVLLKCDEGVGDGTDDDKVFYDGLWDDYVEELGQFDRDEEDDSDDGEYEEMWMGAGDVDLCLGLN